MGWLGWALETSSCLDVLGLVEEPGLSIAELTPRSTMDSHMVRRKLDRALNLPPFLSKAASGDNCMKEKRKICSEKLRDIEPERSEVKASVAKPKCSSVLGKTFWEKSKSGC